MTRRGRDGFEAWLADAFRRAEEEAGSNAEDFVRRVEGHLHGPRGRWLLLLGAAGSMGSVIAAAQLEQLFLRLEPVIGDWLPPVTQHVSAEALAAGFIALMIGAVALALQGRI